MARLTEAWCGLVMCSRFFGGFLPKREAKGFVGGSDPEVLSARLKEAVQRRYLLPEATRLAVGETGGSRGPGG